MMLQTLFPLTTCLLTRAPLDHARLLAPKSSSTSIYIDHLPFGHDDHGYKAMVFSKDKSGDRKVLLEGEYKFSSCRNQAKRKAMEALLKKSGDKVKEEMEKHEALATGRWVFLSD
jgi:hypothetical protein